MTITIETQAIMPRVMGSASLRRHIPRRLRWRRPMRATVRYEGGHQKVAECVTAMRVTPASVVFTRDYGNRKFCCPYLRRKIESIHLVVELSPLLSHRI